MKMCDCCLLWFVCVNLTDGDSEPPQLIGEVTDWSKLMATDVKRCSSVTWRYVLRTPGLQLIAVYRVNDGDLPITIGHCVNPVAFNF